MSMAVYRDAASVRTSLEGSVLRLTLDAPARRNALDDAGIMCLIDNLDTAQRDEAVRAVLVVGEGAHFCGGFDIVARNAAGGGERPRVGSIQRRLPSQAHRLLPVLAAVQVPVVCGVSGYAVGLGFQMALAADFVVADASATFWQPFIARGMTPDSGATWLTTRAVGPLRARQLLMLGRRLDAREAAAWGIVHEVVEMGEAVPAAERLASDLAAGPTVALGLTKALLHTAAAAALEDQLRAEAFALELSSRSPDFREGLQAFVERRTPRFSGR